MKPSAGNSRAANLVLWGAVALTALWCYFLSTALWYYFSLTALPAAWRLLCPAS